MYKYSAVLWFSLTEEDFIIETYFINSCVFIIIIIIIKIIIIKIKRNKTVLERNVSI